MSEDLDQDNSEKETIQNKLKEIINNPELTDDQKEEYIASFVSVSRSFSGPIPSPEVLSQYNQAVENGAERVLKMAEKQSDHRMELEKYAIKRQIQQSGRGQYFGFALALLCIGSTVFLAMKGFEDIAKVLGTTTVISLVGVFVVGKLFQSKKDEEE